MASVAALKAPVAIKASVRAQRSSRRPLRVQAMSDANLVVGACTVGALALGRFVFLPQHRAALKKAGVPTQNGKTHFEAGDRLAEEASFVLKTFNIVDVMAWGALGHAAAFYILATHSLTVDRFPFH